MHPRFLRWRERIARFEELRPRLGGHLEGGEIPERQIETRLQLLFDVIGEAVEEIQPGQFLDLPNRQGELAHIPF